MLVFSELLKKYINENKISVKKLSSELHMDRTLMQKYMSGNRIPKNYLEVERIGQVLLLLPQQQEELLEAYYRDIYGDKNYESYIMIKDALEGVRDFRIGSAEDASEAIEEDSPLEHRMVKGAFYGKLAVEHAFVQFIRAAYSQRGEEKLKIKMLVQPDQEELLKIILHAIHKMQVAIEHIICMDKERGNNNNITLLFSMLALIVSTEEYSIRYYYDNITSHINKMSLLPNMVLVEGHVFLCNRYMDQCLILHDDETAAFFERQYESIRKMTKEMNINTCISHRLAEPNAVNFIGIGYFPCFLAAFSHRQIEEYFSEDTQKKEHMLKSLEHIRMQVGNGWLYRDYFSEKAIREFMETGDAPLYLNEGCRNLKKRERLLVLMRFVELIKEGSYQAYMSDESRISMDLQIEVMASETGYVSFLCRNSKKGTALMVKESSICESLYGFEKFVIENDWFYSREETLKHMEKMLEEYSREWGERLSHNLSHVETTK